MRLIMKDQIILVLKINIIYLPVDIILITQSVYKYKKITQNKHVIILHVLYCDQLCSTFTFHVPPWWAPNCSSHVLFLSAWPSKVVY